MKLKLFFTFVVGLLLGSILALIIVSFSFSYVATSPPAFWINDSAIGYNDLRGCTILDQDQHSVLLHCN